MRDFTLEVCVDSVESAILAEKAGATRLEVCSNLCIGGTTPTFALFNEIKRNVSIPCFVLIRPRFGDFLYSKSELTVMCEDIKNLSMADGYVIGVLDRNGYLDVEGLSLLVKACNGKHITLHRCIDMCKEPLTELSKLKNLGISTVLTSGGCLSAKEGLENLEKFQREYPDLEIVAGAGVNKSFFDMLPSDSILYHFHMSGKKIVESGMVYRNEKVSMGLPCLSEYELYSIDFDEIKYCKDMLVKRFL